MPDKSTHTPANYKGVMVSSTFTDLKEHRAGLINAIKGQELMPVVMENDAATLLDVLESSLQMVRDASAYVGVISHKYGQTPQSSKRNPQGLSLTELEFDEAIRLERPILLFIMGDAHPVTKADIEVDPEKSKKLEAFIEKAKRHGPDSSVLRVYAKFESIDDFKVKASQSIAKLRRHLDEQDKATSTTPEHPTPSPDTTQLEPDPIPSPPALYAEPPYIGSHQFVGRRSQLEILNDWASPNDSHPVLLFEAIGGAGKSMLTWEWVNNHARNIRDDWAGVFWYSFYERGAIMADFCRRALAYITGQPLKDFQKKRTPELGDMLLHHLQAKPWLIVFDGLERVLVAYHRIDAAQLADEEAGKTDEIANRDPCTAIRPEDDELLRALAGAAPSKLLLTSRLVPRVLLNISSQPVPGVLRERLPGLRPVDAEAHLRACGVTGSSTDIQPYLQHHCDCHPLVIGILAGLINDYLPDRGNFDAWAVDPVGGASLNLADLDLVQKRNHILNSALSALDDKSRQLLSTLALLSEAVDYRTLCAFNPHHDPEPENTKKLATTVRDLEQRGLLQYDPRTKRHDLHPVVRGIAAGGLQQEEKESYGQRVVDHFSQQAHSPYEEAESLEDLRDGLNVVRTLFQMGRHQLASRAYRGGLAEALMFNLEAYAEILSLLRNFFPQGWATSPSGVYAKDSYLANFVGLALQYTGDSKEALAAHGAALQADFLRKDWNGLRTSLSNISTLFGRSNNLALQERCTSLSVDIATQLGEGKDIFMARLDRFVHCARIGHSKDAEAMWKLLDPMGRNWPRSTYRSGAAERYYAYFRFWQGDLKEEDLAHAEYLAAKSNSRLTIRNLHVLRGESLLARGQYDIAANSFHEAIRMAREVGQAHAKAETLLALAQFHVDQLQEPRNTVEQLAKRKKRFSRGLAELWLAIGNHKQAKKYAMVAYTWAWADGEPYVNRYELYRANALLDKLGVQIPELSPYDPSKDEVLPWEGIVRTAIAELRIKNQFEKPTKESEED